MKRILLTLSSLFGAVCILILPLSGAAPENVHGTFYQLGSNFTLYGQVHDANDNTNVYQYQVCWDDPTFTNNCEPSYLTANGYTGLPAAGAPPCSGNCRGIEYSIPAGTPPGWTVTPRDGNDHLIYGRIISQYGNGPSPIDGSPMPFRVINGNVDRTVNIETNPTRLQPAQLAVLANDQNTYSIGSIGNAVCNGGSPSTGNGTSVVRDDGVVGYYIKKWNVPCANVFIVSYLAPVVTYSGGPIGTHTGLSPSMTEAVFNSAILPVLNLIPANLQAIAIGWADSGTVAPASTVGPGNLVRGLISMTAAVATKGIPAGTACVDPVPGLMGYGPANPYYNSTSKTPYTDFGIRPTMFLAAEMCQNCAGSGFTNGSVYGPWDPDAPSMMRVIDAAFNGRDTNPANAKAYWAYTNAGSPEYVTANGIGSANLLNSYLGFANRLANAITFGAPNSRVTNTTVGAADPVYGVPDHILMYANASPNYSYLSPATLPGASVGWANRSTVGSIPYDNNQTPMASWLNNGFVAAYGTAVEPCENFPAKYPHGDIFLKNYTQGQTVIESIWKSVEQIYAGNSTGDPLAAPFSLPSLPATSILPSGGVQGSIVIVTLSGSGFAPGATLSVSGSGVTASTVVVVSPNLLTAILSIGVSAAPGTYNISVSGAPGSFAFNVSGLSFPVLSSLSRAAGAQGTTVNLTLTGSNFMPASTVAVSGSGVTVSNVSVLSSTQITATLTIAANASATAIYTLSVATAAGVSGSLVFDVTPAGSKPTLSSVTPSSGTHGTAVAVVLTGANFVSGSSIGFSGSGVTVGNIVVSSATSIRATFTLSATATAGVHTFTVTTPSGTSNSLPFTVNTTGPSLTSLTSLSPSGGLHGTTVNSILTGSSFIAGAKVNVSGSGVTVSNIVVLNATTITASFHIATTAATGSYNVTVATSAGTSNAHAFTVGLAIPILTTVAPNSGLQGTSLRVALKGANFTSSAAVKIAGAGLTVSNISYITSGQLNITITISSTVPDGSYNVSVSTSAGTSGSMNFDVGP